MNNLLDLFKIIDEISLYLKERGFIFSDEGYPVFTREMFLTDTPEMLIPVQHRKNRRVCNKKKTVLVFFCADKLIYRRLKKLLSEIEEYSQYMGVVEPDITVTYDMDIEWQRAIMLLNQLVMAVFAVNGIKVILNTRTGRRETQRLFDHIPKRIMIASGFRGGSRKYDETDFGYVSKIIELMPLKVLIYGSCHDYVGKQLNDMGIDFEQYPDFRSMCKGVA